MKKFESNTQFYKASSDWLYNMYQSQTVWLKRAIIGLVLLLVLLTISMVTNFLLVPLKEKVPYLYAFDHATGEITKIGTLEPTVLSSNWELSRYFIIHYVINYESYDFDNIDRPYQLVWAQSSETVKKQYDDLVRSDNASSPYKLYGKDKIISVRVISVSRLNDNTVDVKFDKKLQDRATSSEQILHKEAIIKWEYAKAEISQKMLDRDPLGFKVTYYQVSQVNLDTAPGV